jgi:hypothetical protein
LWAQVEHLRSELEGLRVALRTRATIEQAVGVLIVSHHCSPQEAFQILVSLSQHNNLKLYRVARVLVELAARTAPEQLERLLRRARRNIPPSPERARPDHPDQRLVELARKLLEAGGSEAALDALSDLHEFLIDSGWVPPYEVLAGMRRGG